jgi:hypothetical protein
VFHQDDDLLGPGDEIHPAAHALIILPGIIQFAMSPDAETCIAPRIAASIFPPRGTP